MRTRESNLYHDPIELEVGLAHRLLRGAPPAGRLARLAGADPQLLAALPGRLRTAGPPSRQVLKNLEQPFLRSERERLESAGQGERDAARLADLLGRMTYLGSDVPPRVWDALGWVNDDPAWPLGLSRDGGHVILVSGIQGSGKTILSTVLCEGGLGPGEPLRSAHGLPTAHVFFHIEEHDRLPQLLDGLKPNPTPRDLELLAARFGVQPRGLGRLRLVAPESLLKVLLPRLQPYLDLGLEVLPLKLQLGQFGQPGLEAYLGADEGTRYVQRMLEGAGDQGKDLTLRDLHRFIEGAHDLTAPMKRAAHARLEGLDEIESPPGGPGLWDAFGSEAPTVVYLGGPHMPRTRVAPLVVGLLNGLMLPSPAHGAMQRVIVVDEVNLIEDEAAWRAFIRVGRLVRHRGSTLVLMGQDLLCVPDELFGLAGLCFAFQQRNPRVWDHIRERVGALRGHRFEEVAGLPPGEALVGATVTTANWWRQGGWRVRVRPPLCMHGGMTKAAV